MLKNRLAHKKYEELTPTVILRKSKGRTNVEAIVINRIKTVRERKANQPAINSEFTASGYGTTKGGYALNCNGKPLGKRGHSNPLSSRI